MKWHELNFTHRLAAISSCKLRGLMLKETAAELGMHTSTLTKFSAENNIIWARGARYGNKNAEIHGRGHNTIKRLTRRVLISTGRSLFTCERCNWVNPLGEALARHHKDQDRNNNDPSNLEVLCGSCHSKEHINDRQRNEFGQFKAADDSGGSVGGT